MYGKHFESMYTGSMFGIGPVVFAVWGYVISHTKQDAFVELNPDLLGAILGCESEQVAGALEQLSSPDPKSRSKAEGGRRLIKEGQYIYRVVNYLAYREMRNDEERRTYNREKQRQSRARRQNKSNGSSLTVNDMSTMSAHTDTEAEAETKDNNKKAITVVLEHYTATHPRRKVGDLKQERVVAKALKFGFTVEDLKQAITGNANDPWHREKGKHELSYVLRDADHINTFLEKSQQQDEPVDPAYLP